MTCFRLNDGQTLLKYCKDNNINYSRVYIRIGRGLSIEQALAEACERRGKRSENNLKYMLGGKSVHSQLTPTEYTRFKRYVHVRGFSVEKSFNLAKRQEDDNLRLFKSFYGYARLRQQEEKGKKE